MKFGFKLAISALTLMAAASAWALPFGRAYHIEYVNGGTRDFDCFETTVRGNASGQVKSITYGASCNKTVKNSFVAE